MDASRAGEHRLIGVHAVRVWPSTLLAAGGQCQKLD